MKEKNFWNTKEGKILSHGIHEHNLGLSTLSANINFLAKDFVRNEKIFSKEDHERMLKTIKQSIEKCKNSIDYIYENIKKNSNYE